MAVCHPAPVPIRPGRWPHIDREQLPLDERLGQYVLNQPLVRSARENPEVAGPWIVLGLVVVLAGLVFGMAGVLLVLLVGFPTLIGARLLASRRRRERPVDPEGSSRLALILAWVAAACFVIVILATLEVATGNTGIVLAVGAVVAFPILGKALQMIFRA